MTALAEASGPRKAVDARLQDFYSQRGHPQPLSALRQRRNAILAEVLALDKEIAAGELRRDRARCERAMATAAAQAASFRDGTPKKDRHTRRWRAATPGPRNGLRDPAMAAVLDC